MSYFIENDRVQHDGSPESVRAYINKIAHEKSRYGKQPMVLENVTSLIVPRIISEANKQNDPKRAYSLAYEAMRVIDDLDCALHSVGDLSESRSWLWRHIKVMPGPTNTYDQKYNTADQELLEDAAGKYLARPWMRDDYIDWCIIDALVHMEYFAFARHIWNNRIFSIISFVTNIVFLAACLWGIWHGYSWAPVALPFAAVAALSVLFLQRRGTDSSAAQFLAMYEAYKSLDSPILSPTRVGAAIEAAKDKGVVWPQAIWPMIDAVVARDPNVWRVSPFQRG